MNASDIVKAKQNKTVYSAYYKPNVYQSTIYSTLTAYSSIVSGTPSFTSCSTTVYTYIDNPTFINYETLNEIKHGAEACGAAPSSQLQFTGISTTIYAYKPMYSTINRISTIQSYTITSSIASIPTGPVIPSVQYKQGCTQCATTSPCTNCLVQLAL